MATVGKECYFDFVLDSDARGGWVHARELLKSHIGFCSQASGMLL